MTSMTKFLARGATLFVRNRVSINQSRNIIGFSYNDKDENKSKYFVAATAGLIFGLTAYVYKRNSSVAADSSVGIEIKGLPKYKLKDVREHSSVDKKIWVTYKEGVYDITDFIEQHPGGKAILMAAGGSVEPFWLLYGVHKQPKILDMLEKYRIGNLDSNEAKEATSNMQDPYSSDPVRHPALKPSSEKPFNAEPPPELLVESFLTPQSLFYVRNHLPVPEVEEKTFELEIEGVGIKSKTFSLEDLKKMPKYTVTSTVMCAGNRRSEMNEVKPVKGLSWGHAAIGNAEWSGPKLYDVLLSLGFKNTGEELHVQFEGLDTDPTNTPYGASIPIEKAFDPNGDVILAYEMNGEPLSKDHGYPLRVIVPGVVGARNVKWLTKIIVSKDESFSHWQRNDYKGFSPSVDWDTVDFSKSQSIQELPVISAICYPKKGDFVKKENGKIIVKGYAWSGGGRKIVRIDVTSNAGDTWYTADLEQENKRHPYHWGWTLWKIELPVNPNSKEVEIWAKAVDSSYNTQPESFKNIWNLRGVNGNAYHRVKINLTN